MWIGVDSFHFETRIFSAEPRRTLWIFDDDSENDEIQAVNVTQTLKA